MRTIQLISKQTQEDIFGIKDLSVLDYRYLWHWITTNSNSTYVQKDFYRIAINAVNKCIYPMDTYNDILDQHSIVQDTTIHLFEVFNPNFTLQRFPNALLNKSDRDFFAAYLHKTAFYSVRKLVNKRLLELERNPPSDLNMEVVKQFRWGCDWDRYNAFDDYHFISILIDELMDSKKVRAKILRQKSNQKKGATIKSLHDEVMRRRSELYSTNLLKSDFNRLGKLDVRLVQEIDAYDYLTSFIFEANINGEVYSYHTRYDYHWIDCSMINDVPVFSCKMVEGDYWADINPDEVPSLQ